MSFWEDMRREVCTRTTTGDVSTDIYETIMTTGVTGLAVIQPTFYLGRFYILCFDFMDFVEKLLASGSDSDDVLRLLLYIRETASTMGRCIRNAAEPVDGMMNFLDPIYEKAYTEEGLDTHVCDENCGCHEGEEEDEDLDDEFIAECEDLEEELKKKFLQAEVVESVASELSRRLAQTYSGCVTFVRELRGLYKTEPNHPISEIMVSLIDVQYIMDTKLRRLLLEDVFMEESPAFTTGLMPWISHAVEDLARLVSARPQE